LLLPDYLLDQESIIRKIVNDLSDENFFQIEEDGTKKDNVEVLGWLYQYYMSEKKEQVGGLKNRTVSKEDLPVVTQLFTPKWIVQYLVQNSLGKLYDEKYEDNQLARHWDYYLKHEENHYLYPETDSLEDLKILDPACGSGHILLYAFDMLYEMYEECGYPSRDIPQLILEKNLYGLDIDKRAQQIANFTLLMKAAEKQPRFISRLSRKGESPKINVYEIVDTDQTLSEEAIDYFTESEIEKSLIDQLMNQFENGKQFGSLINPIEVPYEQWIARINEIKNKQKDLIEDYYYKELKEKLLPVLKQAYLLYQKYDVVVTNPPYHNKYNQLLKSFMMKNYNEYKMDLYSAFIYKCTLMTKQNGYSALMTPFTWMFIKNHQNLRKYLISNYSISSLIQLEYSAFKDATVPICTFVIHLQNKQTIGEYVRLSEYKGEDVQPIKVKEAALNSQVEFRYSSDLKNFHIIPGSPIAYWASTKVIELNKLNKLKDYAKTCEGITTADNDRFLRLWTEVSIDNIKFDCLSHEESKQANEKWYPYNKGGEFRRWYGNNYYVINWKNDGEELRNFKRASIRNADYYFKEGITWSTISSGTLAMRYYEKGKLFDTKGNMLYVDNENLKLVLGFVNSKLVNYLLKFTSPTLDYRNEPLSNLPFIKPKNPDKITTLVDENIELSKEDWDSYEISYNFKVHPLLKVKNSNILSEIYDIWANELYSRRRKIKENEMKINEFFIELFGLEDELDSMIPENEITLRKPIIEDDVKSLLSYFIGCLMGRYSLDEEGIVFAGGEFQVAKYVRFKPNSDGLILLTEDLYFENDIILRLKEFLSVAFSSDTVEENILWLAESLGMKKSESPEERLRRYFIEEFFHDHCKIYQKRPIYWLVDSGKQKGLRTLIYMHRYQQDTMATIRFDHLQEIQEKYQNEIEMIDTRLANPNLSATDRRNLEKSKTNFQKKIKELQEFDKHLALYANEPIEIDLDDGVKVNYSKFGKVLAKIK
jgi:type II restriction/modification system DNA methylase subunit YeeA